MLVIHIGSRLFVPFRMRMKKTISNHHSHHQKEWIGDHPVRETMKYQSTDKERNEPHS
jgi:hypothetical protein